MPELGKVFALLVGIDHYLPREDGKDSGPEYKPLSGCVYDALSVADFLNRDLGIPKDHLKLLLAPDPPTRTLDAELPTYDHLVAAFHGLLECTQPGDAVWIHYSGHGGRTPTVFSELKGQGGYDEALVPTDVGRRDSQYLRDVELGFLLERLVRRGLFVTLVLDCCHAGGMIRDDLPDVAEPRARSNQVVDWLRDRRSIVAAREDLVASWHRFGVPWMGERVVHQAAGAEVAGFVLIAACRSHERAWEYEVEPGRHGGALTHWLLETMRASRCEMTYQQCHERLRGLLRTRFDGFQTPEIQGEVNRRLFSGEVGIPTRGVTVLTVEPRRVLLATGEAQGVHNGDRFALRPLLPEPLRTDNDDPLALVEIEDAGGGEAWARWLRRGHGKVRPGDRAIPADFAALRHRVRYRPGRDPAWRRLLDRLLALDTPFLEWTTAEEETAFELRLDSSVCEILIDNGRGGALAHPVPCLRLGNTDAESVLRLLERLARYRSVEVLCNRDLRSPLADAIGVSLWRLAARFRPFVDALEPIEPLSTSAILEPGAWVALKIENNHRRPLDIAVLDLTPQWSIEQAYPTRGDTLTLDEGAHELLPFQVRTPPGRHRLKTFATLDAVRWHWLELPLGRHATLPRTARCRPGLEELIAALACGEPMTRRTATRSGRASREWTVRDVMIEVSAG